ncbi:MAG: T9SS type A sorting domain-containing protein [Bacteroidota bacterium]
MRHLLLALALALPIGAGAQAWSYDSDFPTDTDRQFSSTHGIAVDGEDRVWVQPFGLADSVDVDGTFLDSGTVLVFNADGSEAGCSPIRFLADAGGAVIDTLGIATNASGSLETQTGRGLRADKDGNVLITQGNLLFKVDHTSCGTGATANTVTQLAKAQPFTGSMVAGGTDAAGNFYMLQVVGGSTQIKLLDANLNEVETFGNNRTFNRTMLAADDGGGDGGVAVWDFSYTTNAPVVYYRPDDLSTFDSLGVSLRGMAIESADIHPVTGDLWFSAGSADSDPAVGWTDNTWYAFALEDLFTFDGSGNITATIEDPTPRDSMNWQPNAWNAANTAGRPRAIDFSADGMTAYVGQFSQGTPATQKLIQMETSAEGGPTWVPVATLGQNQPNPVTGRTDIAFTTAESGLVRVRVFDTTGRVVATVVDQTLPAGEHHATFDASDLAAGVYVYSVEVNGFGTSRQMTVVR